MAQELVAAADGHEDAAVLDEGANLLADGQQVVTDDALVAVGATANEGDVDVTEAGPLAGVDLANVTADASPLHALAQAQDVAGVAVEVQQLGEQVGDANGT